jgi:uncharacterized protein with ParB-like and HNH nuclease domain
LVLAAPFQRNAVWTELQQAYLIDTVLHGFPIPELYMQDKGDAEGNEEHVVVDGQQRIRAVLNFIQGAFSLDGDDVSRAWRGKAFDDLSPDQRKDLFNYKFVVRILPSELDENEIRAIFARLNKNVVALNDQELRNATYWGPFIKTIQKMADDDLFWSEAGVFSANDHRRMLDHEFISELVVAFLHGPQNKKDRLDHFYQVYEQNFDQEDEVKEAFRRVTGEISSIIPDLRGTRWRKKSDFYTFFLEFALLERLFPLSAEQRRVVGSRILEFGSKVDALLRLEEQDWGKHELPVVQYGRSVARAATDRSNRVARGEAFRAAILHEIGGPTSGGEDSGEVATSAKS